MTELSDLKNFPCPVSIGCEVPPGEIYAKIGFSEAPDIARKAVPGEASATSRPSE